MRLLATILLLTLAASTCYAQMYSSYITKDYEDTHNYTLGRAEDQLLLIYNNAYNPDYSLKEIPIYKVDYENNVISAIQAQTITTNDSKVCVYTDDRDSYLENYYLSESSLYIAQTKLRVESTRQVRLQFDLQENPKNTIGVTNAIGNPCIDDISYAILDIPDYNSSEVTQVILKKDLNNPEKSQCLKLAKTIPSEKSFEISSSLYDKNDPIGIVTAKNIFLLKTLTSSQISSIEISSGNIMLHAYYTENYLIILHSYQNKSNLISVFTRNNPYYLYSVKYDQEITSPSIVGEIAQYISGDIIEFTLRENIIRFDFEKREIISDYSLPFQLHKSKIINENFNITTRYRMGDNIILSQISLTKSLKDSLRDGCTTYEIMHTPVALRLNQHSLTEIPLLSSEIEHFPNSQTQYPLVNSTDNYSLPNLATFNLLEDTICKGLTIKITDDYFTSGTHTWSLYTNSTLQQEYTEVLPEITPQTGGDYLLIHELTYGSCTYRDSTRFHIFDQEIKIKSPADYICHDSTLTLSASLLTSEVNQEILWTKDGEIITRNQQEIEIDEGGTYHATIDNPACPLSDAITISKLNQEIVKILNPTESYCEGDTLKLNVEVSIPSGTISRPSEHLNGVVPDTFFYVIESNCGEYADTIIIDSGQNCNAPEIYIPNAFSPNGDGINDEFSIYSSVPYDINMQIYDRWGARIFQCKGSSESCFWDGKRDEIDGNAGVYIYKIVIQAQDEEYVFTGEVSYME